jgi:hypothetical protein
MRPESKGFPDLTVPVRRRCAPIAPMSALGSEGSPQSGRSPALAQTSVDDQGDSRVVAEALVQLAAELGAIAANHDEPTTQRGPRSRGAALMAPIRAGRRPVDGADMSFVDPVSIAFLAIVRVVTRCRRQGLQLGQGVHQPLPENLHSLPRNLRDLWTAAQPQALEMLRPAVSERIVHRIQPGSDRTHAPYHFPRGQVAETALTRHSPSTHFIISSMPRAWKCD